MAVQWGSVKKALTTESRSGLLKLIKDLYELRPENRTFLQARIQQGGVSAAPYRQRVEQAIAPDPLSSKQVSIRAGRQAIREFRRATSDAAAVADLMLHYVECGTDFATDLGYGEEGYFSSLEGVFAEMLEQLSRVNRQQYGDFVRRIQDVIDLAGRTGWGYQDQLRAEFDAWSAKNAKVNRRSGGSGQSRGKQSGGTA